MSHVGYLLLLTVVQQQQQQPKQQCAFTRFGDNLFESEKRERNKRIVQASSKLDTKNKERKL